MNKPRSKLNTKWNDKASHASRESSNIVILGKWPFGNGAPPVNGWLRSKDPDRTALIRDYGHGLRGYPDSIRGGDAIHLYDSVEESCSNEVCEKMVGPCVHAWEDAFRFGRYRGGDYLPPARWLLIRERQSEKYLGVERHRERPNPTVDGLLYATHMRHARERMPARIPELVRDLAQYFRLADAGISQIKRRVGRPNTDIYDIAAAAILRIYYRVSLESLASYIPEWYERGYLSSVFTYNRVDGALTGKEVVGLALLLDRMCLRLERLFRKIARHFTCDGVVFSTRSSDNPRTSRTKGVLITCHSLYNIRWGLPTGLRLTWHARGRGSGEAPQFPYLVRMTQRVFTIDLILGDGPYGSDRNFAFADSQKIRLLSPINPDQFDPSTKRYLTPERAAFHLRECNKRDPAPMMRQVYPFRNRQEGWHAVVRDQTEHFILSRPERNRMPQTLVSGLKDNPNRAEAELPEEQTERDAIIDREQFVGVAVTNEVLCRRAVMLFRAVVRAEVYYNEEISLFGDQCFGARPEDEAFSIFRPPDIRAS